jgi:hypothetical protein
VSRRPSTSSSAAFVALTLALVAFTPARALAQACCAGAGVLTPGRLAIYQDALVGTQVRAGTQLGTYDDGGHYASVPHGDGEYDLEQDLFGAVRVLRRGQVALLLPIVETQRHEQGVHELGGGIGDVNLSGRYDFVHAGESKVIPGIAGLVGLTIPTGRPPDEITPSHPLGTDATGTGAWQGNVGVAVEQVWGHWLVNATQLLAWRAPRTVDTGASTVYESLAPQFVTLLGTAYSFDDDASVALFGSYTFEGTATLDGGPAAASARRIAVLSLAGAYPLSDHFRIQASAFTNPPISSLGRNQTATTGLTFTFLWTLS